MEEGGTVFNFEGKSEKKFDLKVSLKVHTPQFYWKVCNLKVTQFSGNKMELCVLLKIYEYKFMVLFNVHQLKIIMNRL